MIRICAWNVNGYQKIIKHGLQKWIEETDPDIFFLMENKIDSAKYNKDNGYMKIPECYE